MSIRSYQQTQTRAESPRALEYRAFAITTGRLADSRGKGHRAAIEACHANRQLWDVLLADLVDPRNALPAPLKGNLISLAIWVKKHSSQVLRGEATVDALIDVNRALMDGLAQPADDTATAATAPPPAAGLQA